MTRSAFALLVAAGLAATVAAPPGVRSASADPVSESEARRARFEHALLSSHLELATHGAPYFTLDPLAGEMSLLVSGVALSRFPAEKHLVGGRLRRLIDRKDPASVITKPFRWVGLDEGEKASGVGSLVMRLEPPLRIEFEASPSDFFWRWLRFNLVDRLGGKGKDDVAMSVVLFYPPDSLATMTPLLADSLPVLLLPNDAARAEAPPGY